MIENISADSELAAISSSCRESDAGCALNRRKRSGRCEVASGCDIFDAVTRYWTEGVTMGAKSPTANDIAVGQRIRQFRKAAGLSQTELADQIGITFQQVQKYENGTNRVGAGRLSLIAKALDIPITTFFDGIGQSTERRPADSSLDELMAEPRAYKLLEAFSRFPDPLQLAVLRFVRSVRTATRRRKKS